MDVINPAAGWPAVKLGPGIYAIVGICKNSGKTSLLNCLISTFTDRTLGVMTTGRDGEETDAVYGNPKPAVHLSAGTLFTASSPALAKLGSAVTVLEKLTSIAGSQRLWLLIANRSLETEITGPATALTQIRTAELMQARGAITVFIDGSLERKSVALQPQVKGVFLVAGGSFGSLAQVTDELSRLVRLAELPLYRQIPGKEVQNRIAFGNGTEWLPSSFSSLLGNEPALLELIVECKSKVLYLPGALTESVMQNLKPAWKTVRSLVLRHPLQLHLGKAGLEQLSKLVELYCLNRFNLTAVVLNSWSVSGNHLDSKAFRDAIRKSFPALPVLDICEA